MGIKAEDFAVKVIRTERVGPKKPLHDHRLPFTNLDLLVPPFDVGSFFCYNKTTTHHDHHDDQSVLDAITMVDALKTSLSEALTFFYPLAGEIVCNAAGEPEIHCNNKGVDFIEADADVKLEELDFHTPDSCIEGKLMPKRCHGVLAVQVTMLKCGGLVIATMFDHRVADGYSANMFVSSWADITRSQPPSFSPTFSRSVLKARHPTIYTPLASHMFLPLTNLQSIQIAKNSEPCTDQDMLLSRIYYIEGGQLKKHQILASENGCQRSKLESFTSFLWKITAMFMEDSGHRAQFCNIAVSVDGRRLCEGEGVEKEELMTGHFGNVLSIPFGMIQSKDLKVMPLSSVANEVHKFLKNAANKEHFMELIDWVEDQRPKPLISRAFAGMEKAVSIMVSSRQRFSIMDKMDFGWGKLVFGSCYVPVARTDCFVMTLASPVNEDDWIVYMHLPRNHLNHMETHAGHLFKPLSSSYLKL